MKLKFSEEGIKSVVAGSILTLAGASEVKTALSNLIRETELTTHLTKDSLTAHLAGQITTIDSVGMGAGAISLGLWLLIAARRQ